jgi:tRNA A-37 threonylcarbamoyl transferase component Bud32
VSEAPPDASQTSIELSVPFGQALVQEGLATSEQIEEAVTVQSDMARRGVFLRLGELLVARGVVGKEGVAKVLELQGTAILVCRQCMAQYNVLAYQATKRYRCKRCREILTRPGQLDEVAVEDTLVAEEWKNAFDLDELDGGGATLGDYAILGRISRGGMGIIYKARQKRLDRLVAMKVLITAEHHGEMGRDDFRKEARAVAKLRHPYIIAIHDVGEVGGVDYFTMDYVEGVPINRAVASEGLSDRDVVESFVKVCDAVSYSHGKGMLHRDIKPDNILLDRNREPVLIDFGIARFMDESEDGSCVVGSPSYLPPEYVSGSTYNAVSEVYALGATLYGVLSGRPPREEEDAMRLLRSVKLDPIKPIRTIRRTIDRDLARIVMTCLTQDPDGRYSNVRELATDLRRWLEGDEIAAHASKLVRAWGRMRGKVAATLGLAVALVLPVGTGYFTWQQKQLEQRMDDFEQQSERERRSLHQELVTTRMELAKQHSLAGRHAQARDILERLSTLEGLGDQEAAIKALLTKARAAAASPR